MIFVDFHDFLYNIQFFYLSPGTAINKKIFEAGTSLDDNKPTASGIALNVSNQCDFAVVTF